MISFTTPRTCSKPIVSVKNIGRREPRSKYGRLGMSESRALRILETVEEVVLFPQHGDS
jgi:hypothetical protein